MTLSPGQYAALQNLKRKQAGEPVDWIAIADARTLTDMGLAERNRGGWNITAQGLTALGAGPAEHAAPTNVDVVPFRIEPREP